MLSYARRRRQGPYSPMSATAIPYGQQSAPATAAATRSRLVGMTSSENPAGGIRPRPVVDLLPRYAAGKPPVPVEGLTSYKLSSNENPLPPIPAVQQAIAAQTDFNRYPDPMSSKLRGELAGFLDVPAEDIVTGAGSLGALNQLLATFAGQNDDGKADEVIYAWRSFEAYPISVGLAG